MDARKLVAEAIGTFILVGTGSLGILSTLALDGTPLLVTVPLAFGLGLVAAIAVAGHVSGGHFNPAVTLGAFLDRRLDGTLAVGYVVAQVVGAVAASAMILVLSDQATVAATRNLPGPAMSDAGAFLVEVVLTAIFVAVILTVTKRSPDLAILVIPLTLVMIHVAGIPLSGASVNPARSLGPAIVALDLGSIWIYLAAPLIGAAVGWVAFRTLDTEP